MKMAFRRKDVKKSSYYLWFLGAKESKGLRGDEYIKPVLEYLLNKEKIFEPSKVTLQVSNKGLKIIQNVPKKSNKSHSSFLSLTGKTEQIKHVIPNHAITCVYQKDDVVATIFLIYNPLTKCPVHVHAYRCDTVETAGSLCDQLHTLIDRPDNQRKFAEIERRLMIKNLTENQRKHNLEIERRLSFQHLSDHNQRLINKNWRNHNHIYSSSDGHSSRTDGSDESFESIDNVKDPICNKYFYYGDSPKPAAATELNMHVNTNPKVAILYESLAAELKAKLTNPKSGPLLLPPKDYDTVSRKQGKILEIRTKPFTGKTSRQTGRN